MAWAASEGFHACLPVKEGRRQDVDLSTDPVADRTFSFSASSSTQCSPSLGPFSPFSPFSFPSVENIEHLKKIKSLLFSRIWSTLTH